MESKKYWFALKSYVYVEFKEKNVLLYDTNHDSTSFKLKRHCMHAFWFLHRLH